MRMRHIRLLAATGTAVAALALTACGNGTGTEDEGAAGPTTPVASAGKAASGEAAAQTHRAAAGGRTANAGLEVVADDQGRAVAVVGAVEALDQSVTHLGA
ncbi:hypothetical protein ACWCPB_38495, partial [Streptomyces sp. NPDC001811]